MKTFSKPSFKEWQILPPLSLTPALFRGERENRPPNFREAERGVCRTTVETEQIRRLLFPLPHGEGEFYMNLSANFLDDHD